MAYVFKMYLLLFTIVLILPVGESATFVIRNTTHPDHVGKCYLPGPPPKTIHVGETRRDSRMCAELFCDKHFTIYGATCGIFHGIPPPCRTIPGDPSKPYPHCCLEVIC